jgi:hypothetical protein
MKRIDVPSKHREAVAAVSIRQYRLKRRRETALLLSRSYYRDTFCLSFIVTFPLAPSGIFT